MADDRSLAVLRRRIEAELADAGIPRSSLDADLICTTVLGVSRSWLHCHGDEILSGEVIEVIERAGSRRSSREPLHYILGECPFCEHRFAVGAGCLIPRPETEFLVAAALETFDRGTFVDWGTGSGCIAGSILAARPESSALAVDRSPRALSVAWSNMRRLKVADRCLLWHCAVPERIPLNRCDMIVSNPPYIPTGDLDGLMDDVVRYEPTSALDGGEDGLDPYRVLLPWAEKVLRPGGWLWVEFGGKDQEPILSAIGSPGLSLQAVRPDLSGEPRLMGWRRV
ncbi:MAG: protein-(glutamine-N5) methyltransferase, release factor-specific [Dethiosulfovibrio peptidovorans]|nr:MAG: protein-(glutamine-N5) methyltransferase, release factor-specific [Dethiosulfovibrio peptidovorans]